MDPNQSVKELYERFPYPRPETDLAPLLQRKVMPPWNPRDSFALFFPDLPPKDDLDILIAGCGTNIAQQHAAYLPNARVVGIDISEASLGHARRVIAQHGLKNVELHLLPIEEVASLGRTFDFVHCQGVLHHLESPEKGLRALASVTREKGALSLMVYAKYGRTGAYMLQELFRDRLALQVNEANLTRVQATTPLLPDGHPFKMLHAKSGDRICLEELADLLLHPRDIAYTVEDVKRLVEGAGVSFHRWMAQAQYTPGVSAMSEFDAELARMDPWKRAAAMELFCGRLIMHHFVVTHPGRPTPTELFTDEAMPRAVPILSPHLSVSREGESLVLAHSQHQIPLAVMLPLNHTALLKHVDGVRTIAQISVLAGLPEEASGVAFFRQLYLADMVELRLTNP